MELSWIGGTQHRPNLSPTAAQRYLDRLGLGVEDLFHHVLAVLHDPAYREANTGALRMEWPRIPLPGWPDGDDDGAADELSASAARGRELAALLDSDTPVPGVTEGALHPEIAAVAVPSTVDGGNMSGEDFALTAGWGHFGQGESVMPGQGRIVERPYTPDERAAMGGAASALGETTFDVYLNVRAYWWNVPAAVWHYKLGGYQVLKKWLSYREEKVLGRSMLPEEVQHFTDTARRIGGMLELVNDNHESYSSWHHVTNWFRLLDFPSPGVLLVLGHVGLRRVLGIEVVLSFALWGLAEWTDDSASTTIRNIGLVSWLAIGRSAAGDMARCRGR